MEELLERSREKLREVLAAMLEDSFTDEAYRPHGAECGIAGERYFTPNEQALLTPEARGYLLKLVRADQLSRIQMELILHYVTMFWTAPVGVLDLEDLLDQVVFGMPPDEPDAADPWGTAREH